MAFGLVWFGLVGLVGAGRWFPRHSIGSGRGRPVVAASVGPRGAKRAGNYSHLVCGSMSEEMGLARRQPSLPFN